MKLKPEAAFAAGLWVGAVVIVAIGAFDLRSWQHTGNKPSAEVAADLSAKADEIQVLRQEQARLTAENDRLRETVAELKSNLEARIQEARWEARRIPFRNPPAIDLSEAWIADAVAGNDVQALPRLEEAAQQNDPAALQALALMAEHDGAEALTHVWKSDGLTFPSKITATRYLAATLEVNPHGQELLRSLFASPATDLRLLYAALDGLADPTIVPGEGQTVSLSAPQRPEPDFESRVELLDEFGSAATDERLLEHMDQARAALMARWAQAQPPAQ
jgi:hypothetical protein